MCSIESKSKVGVVLIKSYQLLARACMIYGVSQLLLLIIICWVCDFAGG